MAVWSFPWRPMTAVAFLSAYFLTSRQPGGLKLRLLGTFLAFWFAQVFVWVTWVVVLWPKYFSPLRKLPEPAGGGFFMGQFRRIADQPTGIPMREWISTIPNEGLMRYLSIFNAERLLVTGPKALAEVLVTSNYDFQKPEGMRHNIGRVLGVGVLLAEGEEHKMQRKNLMPAFAFRHVKELYPVFWDKSREVVKAMEKQILSQASAQPGAEGAEGGAEKTAVMEVGSWASRVTLDIIGVAGLGRDFGAIRNDQSELNQTYQSLFKPSRQAQVLALLGLFMPDWVLSRLPVKRNDDVNAAGRYIRTVCAELVAEKKQKLKLAGKDKDQDREKAEVDEKIDHDILTVALQSGGFSDDDLVDQLMTFLAAGHETTASSMTWAVYLLARFPAVQERLREEVRAKLPSPDDDETAISSRDIDAMPYLNAVCSEVLRYYPPVPMTVRDAARDTTVLGQRVPRGTRVILCPWATNFDTALWGADAREFNPDRWMPSSSSSAATATGTATTNVDHEHDRRAASGGASSNYAFMTFLHGPRSCIGQGFARAEFACLLAAWAGRFRFALARPEEADEANVSIRGAITARPEKGMHVHVTVMDGW
ncbi:cytochrome P450 [Xylariaceae sp. FL0804]|nr:cytochrome P450 [Xylariaceae sp. FL0804]